MIRGDIEIPIVVRLTSREHKYLDSKFPQTKGSAGIGRRAVAIVKMHIKKEDPSSRFPEPPDRCDLEIVTGKDRTRIEVKGTSKNEIAWNQLKVSGKHSHRDLKQGMLLYRVAGVFTSRPLLWILQDGIHFEMVPEPRWRIKAKRLAE